MGSRTSRTRKCSKPNGIPHFLSGADPPHPVGSRTSCTRDHDKPKGIPRFRATVVTKIACRPYFIDVTVGRMLANRDSTASTMLRALALSTNALDAAMTLDIDRTADDKAFFQAEKAILEKNFDDVANAEREVSLHELRQRQKYQARVVVGDAVLDRGVRAGKKRTTLETNLENADKVFGEDISEIVDADRHVEPQLVVQCIDRLVKAPDFNGKAALIADLTTRANNQAKNFTDRESAERIEADLDSTLRDAIAVAADALYGLEKRLLERFPREKVYVRAFFLDVGSKRKKA